MRGKLNKKVEREKKVRKMGILGGKYLEGKGDEEHYP